MVIKYAEVAPSANQSNNPTTNTTLTTYVTVPNKYIGGFVQWAGIDHSVTLKNPVNDISSVTLDSSTTIYPAAELHGSIYLPEGNVIIGDSGDVYIGSNISLLGVIAQLKDLQCRVCNLQPGCCGQNAALDVNICECVCNIGYSGQGCTNRACYNNGTWEGDTGTCSCPYPYTAATMCMDFDCGPNAVVVDGVCTCILPFSGPQCSTIVQTEDSADTRYLWNQSVVSRRSNWGVAACYNTTCVCPPYYSTSTNTIIERQLECEEPCETYFGIMAPLCCTDTVACEQTQLSRIECSTQVCCNKYTGVMDCFSANGCAWDSGCVYNASFEYTGLWKRFVVDCGAVNDTLCNHGIAAAQSFFYHSYPTKQQAFSDIIQKLAWREISQFDIWEDDMSHSIVYDTGDMPAPCYSAWRLAVIFHHPFLASTEWTCGGTTYPQTSFQLELVQNSSTRALDPSQLGSLYRVWVAGTMWCLMDRPLQQDEMYMYKFYPPTGSALIAIDIAEYSLFATQEACGVFEIVDGKFASTTTGLHLSINLTSSAAIMQQQQSGILSLPPIYYDNELTNPRPLPSTTSCRYLPCQVDLLRGYCRSLECARSLLGLDLFGQCLPCLAAHVLLDETQ